MAGAEGVTGGSTRLLAGTERLEAVLLDSVVIFTGAVSGEGVTAVVAVGRLVLVVLVATGMASDTLDVSASRDLTGLMTGAGLRGGGGRISGYGGAWRGAATCGMTGVGRRGG